jgi:uncharacterized protein YdeI (YjbR/CyaY-like superfamily)
MVLAKNPPIEDHHDLARQPSQPRQGHKGLIGSLVDSRRVFVNGNEGQKRMHASSHLKPPDIRESKLKRTAPVKLDLETLARSRQRSTRVRSQATPNRILVNKGKMRVVELVFHTSSEVLIPVHNVVRAGTRSRKIFKPGNGIGNLLSKLKPEQAVLLAEPTRFELKPGSIAIDFGSVRAFALAVEPETVERTNDTVVGNPSIAEPGGTMRASVSLHDPFALIVLPHDPVATKALQGIGLGRRKLEFLTNHIPAMGQFHFFVHMYYSKLKERNGKPLWNSMNIQILRPPNEEAMPKLKNFQRVEVTCPADWRNWLKKNHGQGESIWLVFWKKGDPKAVERDFLVDEALCFGWIDSLPRKLDASRSMILMSPRRKGSSWSKVNRDKVARLKSSGRMQQAGLEKIEQAKRDGSWDRLRVIEELALPKDLEAALKSKPAAAEFFQNFPPSSRRGILEWILMAKKPETRAERVQKTAQLAAKNIKANHPAGRNAGPPLKKVAK